LGGFGKFGKVKVGFCKVLDLGFFLSRGPAYRLPMPLFYFSIQVIETSILITNEVLLLPGKESRLFLQFSCFKIVPMFGLLEHRARISV
jgi:hypothetical protein